MLFMKVMGGRPTGLPARLKEWFPNVSWASVVTAEDKALAAAIEGVFPIVSPPAPVAPYGHLYRNDGYVWNAEERVVERTYALVAMNLNMLKDSALAEVNKERDIATAVPVSYNGAPFDAKAPAISNVMGAILNADTFGLPQDFTWRDENNVDQPMDVVGLKSIGALLFSQVSAAFKAAHAKKDAIRAATTIAELESVL